MDISRGNNPTLKSFTLESRLIESLYLLTTKTSNVSEVTVNWDIDIVNKQITVSYQVPAVHINDSTGATLVKGVDVLGDTSFSTGGDNAQFVSSSLIGQIVEMIYYAQIVETEQSTPGSTNRISATYDSDNRYISGSIVAPITIVVDGSKGSLKFDIASFLN
jgi:hypothetical protein